MKRQVGELGALLVVCLLTPIVFGWWLLQKVAGWFGLDTYSFVLLLVALNGAVGLISSLVAGGTASVGPVDWILGVVGTLIAMPLAGYVLTHWWSALFRCGGAQE